MVTATACGATVCAVTGMVMAVGITGAAITETRGD